MLRLMMMVLCLLSFVIIFHLVHADLRIPPNATDVLYWKQSPKITGNGSKLCNEPSRHLGMFHECSADGGFPARFSTCNCVGCNRTIEFKCNSDDGIWYLYGGFTCTNKNSGCVVCPNFYHPPDLLCEDGKITAGKKGDIRKCSCIHTGQKVNLTCETAGRWDYYCREYCEQIEEPNDLKCPGSQIKTGYVGDMTTCRCRQTCLDVTLKCESNKTWKYNCPKNISNYVDVNLQITDFVNNKQYHFKCLPGYKLIGPSTLTCWNGTRSADFPTCDPENYCTYIYSFLHDDTGTDYDELFNENVGK